MTNLASSSEIRTEIRVVLSLATIFALRMLGFFLVLPIFSTQAINLPLATPGLVGLAFGIYGLTQAIFQLPFGYLSDRFGRKNIITLGFVIFAVGSVLAATADSIYGVIFGRALQGAGAIGSTLIALVADLTPEHKRTRAMAMVGLFIGIAFSLGLVGGALLINWVGFQGLFWLTTGLAFISILVLYTLVPTVPNHQLHPALPPLKSFASVLRNKTLLKLDFGIFCQHMIFSIWIFVLPLLLYEYADIGHSELAWFYFLVSLASFAAMLPLLIIAEKKSRIGEILLLAIVLLGCAQLVMLFGFSFYIGIIISFFIYMVGFNILEACLPSLVSKIAPADCKGTATGVYSTCQFLGIFAGGIIGSNLYYYYSITHVYVVCGIISVLWLFISLSLRKNHKQSYKKPCGH